MWAPLAAAQKDVVCWYVMRCVVCLKFVLSIAYGGKGVAFISHFFSLLSPTIILSVIARNANSSSKNVMCAAKDAFKYV